MIVICAGMLRSGSTWQYQVVCELLRRSDREHVAHGFAEDERLAGVLARAHDPSTWHVVKCHRGNPAVDPFIAAGRAVILYSYRDLRDVGYSMAHKLCAEFMDAVHRFKIFELCLGNDAFWTTRPGVYLQRYEDWVRDDRPAVREIARRLGVDLSEQAVGELSDQFSLGENRRRTEQFTEKLRAEGVDLTDPANAFRNDPSSLLHWNHVRTGEVGGWRAAATPEHLALMAHWCGQWLIDRGYEKDLSWAEQLKQSA